MLALTLAECQRWLINKTVNPKTNRTIKINGPTYNAIKVSCSSSSKASVKSSVKRSSQKKSSGIPKPSFKKLFQQHFPDSYIQAGGIDIIDQGVAKFLSKIDTNSLSSMKQSVKKCNKSVYDKSVKFMKRWNDYKQETKSPISLDSLPASRGLKIYSSPSAIKRILMNQQNDDDAVVYLAFVIDEVVSNWFDNIQETRSKYDKWVKTITTEIISAHAPSYLK